MPEHRIDRLSSADALRALYIDFEGNKDRPPVLLGIHRVGPGEHPHVQQDVTDPLFDGLVPRYPPLLDAVRNVVVRAEHKGRVIVAWTQHELDVVRRDCAVDADLVGRFEARYVNAYAVAKRWRNKLHDGDKPDEGTLYAWLALIGWPVSEGAEAGHVGRTLTSLRTTLEAGRQLSASQLAAWERLVAHNHLDCVGMRRLCLSPQPRLAIPERSLPRRLNRDRSPPATRRAQVDPQKIAHPSEVLV